MIQKQNYNEEIVIKASFLGKFFWYLCFILIFPIFVHIGKRNRIIKFEIKINESDSSVDVQLAKRRDMIVKLADSVHGAMNFEKQTQNDIAALRSSSQFNNLSQEQKRDYLNKMDSFQRAFNIQVEQYPNLKSSELVSNLMEGIKSCEEDLSASRRIYNSNVNLYNSFIQSFPNNVVASSMNRNTKVFFEATEDQQKDVKISLT